MPLLYCITLVLSAGLMFVVEPMFAKMVLCLLGGSPSVWNTCLVFYQAALLAGYVYAHLSLKWLGPRRQAVLHLALLCLPWLVLPIAVSHGWTPQGGESPVPWLLTLLTAVVGLPFLCVAASAPVLQAWYAHSGGRSARDPYFLYAASNFGSLLGLAAYPLCIEPHWKLVEQSRGWSAGYGLLMMLFALCAFALWRSKQSNTASGVVPETCGAGVPPAPASTGGTPAPQVQQPAARPITLGRRLMWFALSLVPSSLLMGVTTHLSVDITPFPLLWAIPLGLYLLSFILVFARWRLLEKLPLIRTFQAAMLALTAALFYQAGGATASVLQVALLHLATFFLTALVCHGELAADRPASRHLTEYYLWMSAGGVAGGLLCALIAPVVFTKVIEYPLMLVAACLLRPSFSMGRSEPLWRKLDLALLVALAAILGFAAVILQGGYLQSFSDHLQQAASGSFWKRLAIDRLALAMLGNFGKASLVASAALVALLLQRRREKFAMAIAAVLVISAICSYKSNAVYSVRSFFGVLRVDQTSYEKDGRTLPSFRLMHGSTIHGAQSRDPQEALEPWTYYHRSGPVGDVFNMLQSRAEFVTHGEIGVVGLGAGSIAAYGKPGQHITYFEIDPAVRKVAENPRYFTYLANCRARWEIRMGDARLTLAGEPDGRFDLLVIDAFSSDAIPVHLITREALAMYFHKLAPHGVLMMHISNRHLRLQPVLARAAGDCAARDRIDVDTSFAGKSASEWVALARAEDDLGSIKSDDRWKPLAVDSSIPPWTDDYSSIVAAINWDWLPWRKK